MLEDNPATLLPRLLSCPIGFIFLEHVGGLCIIILRRHNKGKEPLQTHTHKPTPSTNQLISQAEVCIGLQILIAILIHEVTYLYNWVIMYILIFLTFSNIRVSQTQCLFPFQIWRKYIEHFENRLNLEKFKFWVSHVSMAHLIYWINCRNQYHI